MISKYGAEGGKFCQGGTKEVQACNNYTANANCQAATPIDCVLGEWNASECSATCGGGQLRSTRDILTPSANGGLPCNGTLAKTEPCNMDSCSSVPPIDCAWNAWSEWSVCDKCGGERKRSRTIGTMPKHMGRPCAYENSEEVVKCPRQCHDTIYCVWSDWSAGDCSTKCGKGFIRKERNLIQSTTPGTEKLFEITEVTESSRLQDLAVSFASGSLVTFLVLVVTRKAIQRENRDWNTIRRDPEQDTLIDVRAAE